MIEGDCPSRTRRDARPRYLVLLRLPKGHGAEHVRDALVDAVSAIPPRVRRSLTWDQGVEMGRHDEFTRATDVPVYFCDRASPWQRGTNENTNGLLRQYFPKGTDLTVHTPIRLARVAAELNSRPRKTLGWETPSQRLDTLLRSTAQTRVLRRPAEFAEAKDDPALLPGKCTRLRGRRGLPCVPWSRLSGYRATVFPGSPGATDFDRGSAVKPRAGRTRRGDRGSRSTAPDDRGSG